MAHWFELPDLPIRITARGTWLHGDQPLHPRVQTLFARHVVPAADGTYAVHIGFARQAIVVDDTAFFVVSSSDVTSSKAGLVRVTLRLSDGAEEILDPATLMQSQDNILYCQVLRHGFWVPCRFTSAQYHALALHAEMEGERVTLNINGQHYAINTYNPQPRPDTGAAVKGKGTC